MQTLLNDNGPYIRDGERSGIQQTMLSMMGLYPGSQLYHIGRFYNVICINLEYGY